MDFQTFGAGEFENENRFAHSFGRTFLRMFKRNQLSWSDELRGVAACLEELANVETSDLRLQRLFENLSDICGACDKPIVLMIDEVDSATNNQVFLDFLAQLRAYYIDRDMQATFQSVILSGVYDVKNIRRKICPEDEHRVNSPWNTHDGNEENENMFSFDDCPWGHREHAPYDIAADFNIDMSFSQDEIAGMFAEYEAVKLLLSEKNTLFESLIGKLTNYPELNFMLESLLFTGKSIVYNADNSAIDNATMFGFIRNEHGTVAIANRIFEMRLYNLYLSSSKLQEQNIYKASLEDKNQFIAGGHLNMRLILERFVVHFNELYGDRNGAFLEEEGRKFVLI